MPKKKEEVDVMIKAAFSCLSCNIDGHRFDLGIGFHEIRDIRALVLEKGKEAHKKIRPKCQDNNLRVRIIDSDYVRSPRAQV